MDGFNITMAVQFAWIPCHYTHRWRGTVTEQEGVGGGACTRHNWTNSLTGTSCVCNKPTRNNSMTTPGTSKLEISGHERPAHLQGWNVWISNSGKVNIEECGWLLTTESSCLPRPTRAMLSPRHTRTVHRAWYSKWKESVSIGGSTVQGPSAPLASPNRQ